MNACGLARMDNMVKYPCMMGDTLLYATAEFVRGLSKSSDMTPYIRLFVTGINLVVAAQAIQIILVVCLMPWEHQLDGNPQLSHTRSI